MFSAHHHVLDDNKKVAGTFHTSKRDVPPPLDQRTQSEDDLLSLIGAINSSPTNLRISNKHTDPTRKRSLSTSGIPPVKPPPMVGTLNPSGPDSPQGSRRNSKTSTYDISSDLQIRSKHSPPSTMASGFTTPTSPSMSPHPTPQSTSPTPPPGHNKIEASLLLSTNSHSSSPPSTNSRKKPISIEKGGIHGKRRPSPMGARTVPGGSASKHDDDTLEVVGHTSKGKPAQAFHTSNGSTATHGSGGGGGGGGNGGKARSDEGGSGGPVNPLQDLLQNRITDSEFANIIERQPPEMRWLSVRDLASQVKRLITLLTFTTSISSELDLDKSSEKVAQQVCEILNADRASLYLIEEGKSMLVSKSTALNKQGKAQPMGEIRVPMGVGIAGHVALTGETLNVDDTNKEPLFWSDVDKKTGYRTRTVLCMPVVDDEGRVVAVVEALNKRKPGGNGIELFDGEDERVMKTLAHHAGLSLRNSQLYHSSLLAQRKIQVLLEVASQLASELETTSLITQIMTKARDLLDADRCTLFLLDAERGELWSKVAEGSKEIRVPVTKGIAGHVVTTGEILNIKDAYQDSRFNPEIDKRTGYRTKSILCMPLRNNKSEIIGVTQMINKKDGYSIFELQDEQLLKAFSSQAAVALENAKLFAKTNEMRNYLQSIIQSITNLVLSLDLEGRFFSSNHPTEKFLGVSEDVMRTSTYQVWLGDENKMLADHISMVIQDPGKIIEKTDYELVLRTGNGVGGGGGKLSINYKVVPLVDTTNHVFQGVVVIIEDVTPQKRMMSTLNRYMSPALAEQVVKEGGDRLGGVHLTVSTLFADIRNFTPMSEGMDAAEVVGMLNEYFSYMVGVVFDEGGVLDKYIGDAMMAVFGVPFPAADDPHRACRAALEMLRRLQTFNEKRKGQGEPPISIGIGINTGKVLSGNIGSDKRLEYTVIGDGVNLASRIEGITKSYGVKVLLSEFTYHEVAKDFVTREVDAIRVVGKQQPVKVYELLGKSEEEVEPNLLKNLPVYHNALALYRDRQFPEALAKFQLVAREAADSPSYIFIKRCEQMIREPPGPNWNGVYDFASK